MLKLNVGLRGRPAMMVLHSARVRVASLLASLSNTAPVMDEHAGLLFYDADRLGKRFAGSSVHWVTWGRRCSYTIYGALQ